MTQMYLVCRLCPAVLPGIAMADVPADVIRDNTFYPPMFTDGMRLFDNKDAAEAYAMEATYKVRHPEIKDGKFKICTIPYTDFAVVTLNIGAETGCLTVEQVGSVTIPGEEDE